MRLCLSLIVFTLLSIRESRAQCIDSSPAGDCDQDGIINGLDSDADNDGILDLFECQDLLEESFESRNGISTSFTFPPVSTGIFVDIYALDNSFNINVNGVDLVIDEFQFEPAPSTATDSDMIFASDGTRHGRNGNPNVWTIGGGPGDPIVRIKMSGDGQLSILGKRTTNSALEELIVQPGDPQFNAISWNSTASNTITVNQQVVGPTYINGQIFGLDCNNDSDGDGIVDYIDLDSDNDFCPDAIEGAGNIMNSDLLDSSAIDDGVDECGIPLVLSPQGQGVGTSTDPNLMSGNCLRFQVDTFSPSCIGNDDGSIIVNVINGPGDFLFELLPGQITQSSNLFEMLTAGDYTIIITDTNSSFTTTLNITIPPSPIECLSCQTVVMPFDCPGVIEGSINVMPSGGIPQYCYSINGGPIQKDGLFENLNEGSYVVEISDGSGQSVTCVEEVQLINLATVQISDILCFGDSLEIGNNVYSSSGMYADTLESAAGCDSILNLNLQFLDKIVFDQAISLCKGDSLAVGGNTYTTNGTYSDTLQSFSGCDSIITTELFFIDIPDTNQEITICDGDSLIIAANVYDSPGTYSDTLLSFSGCDSIIITELLFFDIPDTNQEFTICNGDSLVVAANVYDSPGTYSDTLKSSDGCDSIIITELLFFDIPDTSQEFTICDGDSLIIAGNAYAGSGIYRDTLQSFEGCDSILITELNVIDNSEFDQTVELCAGDTLFVGTNFYATSGNFRDTLVNAQGCDSLIYSSVEFFNQIEFSQEARLCPDDFVEVGMNTYSSTGEYMDTLISQSGCDSIVTTIVLELESSQFVQTVELCFGDELMVGSNVYNLSGNYVDVIPNTDGCDSITTTELIVFDEIVRNQIIELCDGDSTIVGTNSYQVTGNYIDTLISYAGCDSIVNTNLSIMDVEQILESFELCAGDSIEHEMGTFHEAGSYTFSIEEENECIRELVINIELESEENCIIECNTYIPNIFSPNDDGNNDLFQPFSKNVTFNEILIFDRWGNKLFESSDAKPTWDGTFQNKKLMPAVFVALIKGTCRNGDEVISVNDLTLIR